MNYQKCFGSSIRTKPQECGTARIDRERFRRSLLRQKVASPRPEFHCSGSGAVVVVQHAAQALASLNLAYGCSELARFWADDSVRQTLVIALTMIMVDERLNGDPQ